MHPQADSTPDVTGISPSEGPPGTKITVRGHNFGIDLNDLVSVFVCAHDCTKSAHWVSNGKLICFIDSINIKGPEIGPIVITTKSGGRGVSMINFNLSFDRLKPLISSSIWIDEDYDGIIPGQQDSLEVDVKQVLCEPDPLGILPSNTFSSGTPLTNESLVQYTSKIVDQSFHPIRFLLDRHPNTKWENLQRGYEQLKRNLNLTSVSEVGNKGDYISKNVVVVINVMSDMYKLSRLVSRQRTHVSDDLKNKIQELMDDISSNFTQLSQTYSSLLSCMSFYNIYIKNLSAFQIPRNILKCIRVKGDYLAVIDSFSEFNNRSPDSDEKLSSVFQSIDSRIDDFIHHVVDNLSLMYPMNFHHILELLKKIEKLSNKTDYSILILKNHQIWISERLELSKQIFLKYLMQQHVR
ncbi:hypothetical protein MXB_5512 [Myxobolus squamalis]|nr:hypothetical protein MXB_5512 [Myxobolus squamalis]